MSTLREAAEKAIAKHDDRPAQMPAGAFDDPPSDAIDALRAELAKPDARPAPAEPQPIAAWSIVRTAESAVVTAVRAALSAAPAPQPAGGERERYEFVLAQCREAQDIAASRGWALNDIATASTTDPRARKIATEALLSALSQPAAQQEQATERCLWARNGHARCPHQERKPLTDEQIDRHSIAAVDCPPSSTVILVSSLRRLLGITATKGGR